MYTYGITSDVTHYDLSGLDMGYNAIGLTKRSPWAAQLCGIFSVANPRKKHGVSDAPFCK